MYSQKVAGRVSDRSVWNIDPVTRYIAPPNFYEQLVDNVRDRIRWSERYDFVRRSHPVISTAPMPIVMEHTGIETDEVFGSKNIKIIKARIDDCDVYQTVYFPNPDSPFYRVSITGNRVIGELLPEIEFQSGGNAIDVLLSIIRNVFMITQDVEVDGPLMWNQRYGKIAPINDAKRKAIIAQLTDDYNIYSLGRFATWRNSLLDDLIADAESIRKMIAMNDYQRKLARVAL
jgi:hypothetical protein